ncbi:MAG TPA: hybrid sensor histidine kinase/response regulator [Cyanobacteria bacterium UBA11049]|nr:hybrid sensor histidine kinase/response regulator [Cyanobacteria bacterium UBA11049]
MLSEEKVNILLVDDHPENLLALGAILEISSYNLVKALSGEEALKCVLYHDFAVILMDVQMPGMNGFEAAAIIRDRKRSRHTPIIFLTAIDKSENRVVTGYQLGAVDYLFKPVVPEILQSKVEVFVDLFKKTEEIKQQAAKLATANQQLAEEIIQRRQAEEQVNKLNQDLEQRAIDLEATNQELRAFNYAVSHDLKAYLNRIAGFSKALQEDYADNLDVEGKSYLRSIHTATDRMAALTNALLRLSKVAHWELQYESVDMSALAQEIVAKLKQATPQRQVEVAIDPKLVVQGDRELLKIALENLLGNAWKYTSKKTNARIEFGASNSTDEISNLPHSSSNTVVYFIRDNGAGFDSSYADKLFNPFHRLHTDAEFEGTGIGLSTVQRIIHRHNGQIWANGAVEQGATFYFVI